MKSNAGGPERRAMVTRMKVTIVLLGFLVLVTIVAWIATRGQPTARINSNASFSMPIDDVFALKTRGKVVVVGVVSSGDVVAGDTLRIRTHETTLPVTVEGLESFHESMKAAKAGYRVGIMLRGVDKEQVVFPATLVSVDEGT